MMRMMQISGLAVFCLVLVAGPGRAVAADVDTSLLPVCAAIARGDDDPSHARALKAHPVMAKLTVGFGADFEPDTDLMGSAPQMLETIAYVEQNLDDLLEGAYAPTVLLPPHAIPDTLKIHFLCGSPSDGYGFVVDGEKQLFIDVGNISADFMPHLMKHEFWHVGFKHAFPDQFKQEFYADDPLRRVAYQMVNEGVGHYYSMRRRLVPQNTYSDWPERTAAIFSLLHEKLPEVTTVDDAEELNRLIYRSHAGVPFWKKWAAVPGAIVTYRLIASDGEAEVAQLIAQGPCAFLSRYEQLSDPDGENRLPAGLIDATCAAADRQP